MSIEESTTATSDRPLEQEPFWQRMNVGRLMILMLPIAFYCETFHLLTRSDVKAGPEAIYSLVIPGILAVVLATCAITGVIIAVRRRATLRAAIVQWCLPPVLVIVLFAISYLQRPTWLTLIASFAVSLSIIAALFRFSVWRGDQGVPWLEGWLGDSVLWGFAQIGVTLFLLVALACFLAPLFV